MTKFEGNAWRWRKGKRCYWPWIAGYSHDESGTQMMFRAELAQRETSLALGADIEIMLALDFFYGAIP